jgi:hypothetical protein
VVIEVAVDVAGDPEEGRNVTSLFDADASNPVPVMAIATDEEAPAGLTAESEPAWAWGANGVDKSHPSAAMAMAPVVRAGNGRQAPGGTAAMPTTSSSAESATLVTDPLVVGQLLSDSWPSA